jgi:hypothetical protein
MVEMPRKIKINCCMISLLFFSCFYYFDKVCQFYLLSILFLDLLMYMCGFKMIREKFSMQNKSNVPNHEEPCT